MERLIPVDQYIADLQKQIDDALWEGDWEDAEHLEHQLQHFLQLQKEGIIYEPRF